MDIQPAPLSAPEPVPDSASRIRRGLGARSLVLVGMMGCGKSSVGKRIAQRLGLPFVDADNEIETAAAMSIADIFASRGEAEFREGEKRVIARLLAGPAVVLATGGGAFMNAETRGRIGQRAVSVWLKAEMDVLMRRVRKRATRPLLQTPDPEGTMRRLLAEREPVYALADLTVVSQDEPHEAMVDLVLQALDAHLAAPKGPTQDTP
jgi:shikimate kinase